MLENTTLKLVRELLSTSEFIEEDSIIYIELCFTRLGEVEVCNVLDVGNRKEKKCCFRASGDIATVLKYHKFVIS